jgi:hypothetical protein
LQYIEASKAQSDHLICVVNNDLQVALKGSKKFMDQDHRCKIMLALRSVDDVWLSEDTDRHVCKTIELIRNDFPTHKMAFFNSGDRVVPNPESPEVILCKKLGIKYVAISLPKLYASSKLLEKL